MNLTSSFAMLTRGALMLCCLLLIPAIAMLGPTIFERFKAANSVAESAVAESPTPSEAPGPETRSWSQSLAMLQAPQGENTPSSAAPPSVSTSPPAGAPQGPQTAVYQAPAPLQATPAPAAATKYRAPLAPPSEANVSSAAAELGPDGEMQVPRPDPFRAMQQRLQELGASYYLLETWGADGTSFRFQCRMPVTGSRNQTRGFEATASDPLKAMQQVLQQVEQWHQAGGRF